MTESRVAVITGASSGLGLETAKALASEGWRVIAVGRNPQRSAAAEAAIKAANPQAQVTMLVADLALLSQARRLAAEIAALTDRVDVLFNNAGGMATTQVMTAEGLEENFAGNHLGPFLLTNLLLPLLRKAAADSAPGSVRIINTSSDAGEMIPAINLDDLQNLANYSVGLAYCTSKLANVLHARGLSQRLAADGIVAHAFHPGVVSSNFFSQFSEEAMARVSQHHFQSPEAAAETMIWLGTAKEPGESSGGYFYHCAPRNPNPVVNDDAVVQRFWDESEKLTQG